MSFETDESVLFIEVSSIQKCPDRERGLTVLSPSLSLSSFQVENLNLLTDSNRLLREERESLGQRVAELEGKSRQLSDDLQQLRENNRTLVGQKDALIAEKTALRFETDESVLFIEVSSIQRFPDRERERGYTVYNIMYMHTHTHRNEVQRWNTRTNQLIEQYNEVDPEEYKKLL